MPVRAGVLRARAPLYFRFSAIAAVLVAARGHLGTFWAWGGRLALLSVLLRRWLRVRRGLPSGRCLAAGGRALEPSMEGLHRRFVELYATRKEEGGGSIVIKLQEEHPEQQVVGMQQRLTLRDGQEVAYWDVGPRDSPGAVLLCNGLGARVAGWVPLLDALHTASPAWKHRRLVVAEYRGQFASIPLVGGEVSVEKSAADLSELVGALGIKTCSLLCWSTGVQVGLQLALDRPDLVEAMVLVQGTTGQALEAIGQPLCTVPGAPRLLGAMLGLAPRAMVGTGLRAAVSGLLLRQARVFERAGGAVLWMFGTDLMPPIVVRYGQDMLQSDAHFTHYCGYVEALGRHRLAARLSGITAPALVVTGTPDFVTPARCSYDLAARLGVPGGAELFDDFGGSHYYIFEEPHKLAARMAAFLDRVAPAGVSP